MPVDETIEQLLASGQYNPAFERVLDAFQDKVFRLAFSFVREAAAAEDLTQEIFLKVWKALPTYHGGASLSTWIYTISRNTCLTEIKRRSNRPTVSLNEPLGEDGHDRLSSLAAPEETMGNDLDAHALLARLPEKYRQVLTLFYLEQRSYEEVGELLGIPMGTVKTFLYRAKKELLKFNTRRAHVPV